MTADREAVIQLGVFFGRGQEESITGVVDTGFTDYLTMPHDMIARFGLPFAAPTLVTLADGNILHVDCYRAIIGWDNQPRTILVIEMEGSCLVGMSLLYGFRVTLDVIDGGNLTIESLP